MVTIHTDTFPQTMAPQDRLTRAVQLLRQRSDVVRVEVSQGVNHRCEWHIDILVVTDHRLFSLPLETEVSIKGTSMDEAIANAAFWVELVLHGEADVSPEVLAS